MQHQQVATQFTRVIGPGRTQVQVSGWMGRGVTGVLVDGGAPEAEGEGREQRLS